MHDTRSGLRINAKCQVMDMSGQVIPGLYCAGESAGGFNQHGLGPLHDPGIYCRNECGEGAEQGIRKKFPKWVGTSGAGCAAPAPLSFMCTTSQLSCDLSIPTMNSYRLDPCEENQFLGDHVGLLLASLRRWTGRDLVDRQLPMVEQARQIFDAPFAVLSHNTAADPILNYGNRAGMQLFELSWDELMQTPSRLTAEPVHRDERARLLDAVTPRWLH